MKQEKTTRNKKKQLKTRTISQEPPPDARLCIRRWGDEFEQGVMKQEKTSRNKNKQIKN